MVNRGGSKMKKSTTITLVLLGTGGLAAMAMLAREPEPTNLDYVTDADQCAKTYSEAECKQAEAKAKEVHVAEAPRFSRKEECEATVGAGNCQAQNSSNGGGGFFMPMMMGYMLGSHLGQPVYRGPDNSAIVRSGAQTQRAGAFSGNGAAARFQPSPEVARGGFGGSSQRYGSASG